MFSAGRFQVRYWLDSSRTSERTFFASAGRTAVSRRNLGQTMQCDASGTPHLNGMAPKHLAHMIAPQLPLWSARHSRAGGNPVGATQDFDRMQRHWVPACAEMKVLLNLNAAGESLTQLT